MIREQQKLVDRMCKIPLPLVPHEEAPVRPASRNEKVPGMDNHHAAVGERRLLGGGLSARAVRLSRVQWVDRADHHHGYHNNRDIGLAPPIPKSDYGRFLYVAMADNKFLPDKCINFKWDSAQCRLDPFVDVLSQSQREMIWERNDIVVDKPGAINNFLGFFVSMRGIKRVHLEKDKALVDRFLDDPRDCAEPLLRRLVSITVDSTDLSAKYDVSLRNGNLPPDAYSTAEEHVSERLMAFLAHVDPKHGDVFDAQSPRTHILNAIYGATENAVVNG